MQTPYPARGARCLWLLVVASLLAACATRPTIENESERKLRSKCRSLSGGRTGAAPV